MDNVEQAMHRLLRTVQTAGDAAARAEAAHRVITAISQQGTLRDQIAATRRDAVNELREQGRSLGEIAAQLDVSRGTVQQISDGRTASRVVLNRPRAKAR